MLPAPVRGLRAAFVFLTRIPVGGFPYRAEDWRWAAAHFPLVGAALGALTGLTFWSLLPLGALPAALIAIAVSMLLTGAFHEDGLADTSDALGGAYDREKLFLILKDSRVGSFGSAALTVSIVLRAALLAGLAEGGAVSALTAPVLAGTLARTGPVLMSAVMPYVSPEPVAKSRDIVRGTWPQALCALGGALAVTGIGAALGFWSAGRLAAATLLLVLLVGLLGWRFHVRAGGVTGDFLGATEQLGEIAVYATLAWSLSDG